MEERHLTVLINPAACKGTAEEVGRVAVARLRELVSRVDVYAGTSVNELREHAALAVAEQPDAIVVVGGDGTLSAVLDELSGSGLGSTIPATPVAVALVPAGTGNDFARAMGIPFGSPSEAVAAAELAVFGRAKDVDLGLAVTEEKTTRFLTVVAVGFDALVSERTNRLRWPRGPMRYYLALLIELLRLRAFDFRISVDGAPARQMPGILAAVGNTASYGGGMPMCPQADPTDGTLDLTHVAPLGRLRLVRLFPLLLKAKHTGRSEVSALRGRSVEISAPGLVAYADGERIGTGSVRVEVLPGALSLLVA